VIPPENDMGDDCDLAEEDGEVAGQAEQPLVVDLAAQAHGGDDLHRAGDKRPRPDEDDEGQRARQVMRTAAEKGPSVSA